MVHPRGADGLTAAEQAAILGTQPPKAKKKPKPKWASTVDLPSPRADDAPLLALNVGGRTTLVNQLSGVDLSQVWSARRFAGSATRRNKPGRPTLDRLGMQVTVESETEAVFAHSVEVDPSVVRIIPQPFWIKRRVPAHDPPRPGPKWTWVCPDFLIQYDTGELHTVEVKRSGFELNDAAERKYRAVASACVAAGSAYVLREGLSDLERQIFYLLHLYRRTRLLPVPDPEPLRALVLEEARRRTTFERLWALGEKPLMLPVVWWMVWHQDICMDWESKIKPNSPVRAHGPWCRDVTGTSAWDFTCGPRQRDLILEFPRGVPTGPYRTVKTYIDWVPR